jgi:flavin-dependent dehydrogenase
MREKSPIPTEAPRPGDPAAADVAPACDVLIPSASSTATDAAIIGAGPAGSIAAICLARAGWKVTLIEQSQFPRDKVCGECLSSVGLDVLARLGLQERLRKFRPAMLCRAALHSPDGGSAVLPLPRVMWGISRSVLDQALRDAAAEAGAEVLQPARCEAIFGADEINDAAEATLAGRAIESRGDSSLTVRVRDLTCNRLFDLRPTIVVVADGKAALLPTRPKPTTDFGLKAHFTGIDAPPETIELFGVTGCYGGLAPIDPAADVAIADTCAGAAHCKDRADQGIGTGNAIARWNAAFSVPATRLSAARGDLDGLFRSIVQENRALAARFRRARRIGLWLTSPLPRFAVSRAWPENIYPIGNAAAALEPVGGEGMGLAMRSAEMLGETLIRAARESGAGHGAGRAIAARESAARSAAELRRRFTKLWRTRRLACRSVAVLMSRPAVADLLAPAIAASESLGIRTMLLMGKR